MCHREGVGGLLPPAAENCWLDGRLAGQTQPPSRKEGTVKGRILTSGEMVIPKRFNYARIGYAPIWGAIRAGGREESKRYGKS